MSKININLNYYIIMLNLFTLLKDNDYKLSVAESCTGGNLQAFITSRSGASEVFRGGITCYTIDQKVKHLGVDWDLAEEVDCVSLEVADQMALGCVKMFGTGVAVSTTGYIEKYLYYSIVINGVVEVNGEIDLSNYKNRREAQQVASIDIINVLEKTLESIYSPNNII